MQNLSSVVEVNKYVFTRGCLEAISELVERNMNLVAGICLGSALAQVSDYWLMGTERGMMMSKLTKLLWAYVNALPSDFLKSAQCAKIHFSFSLLLPHFIWHTDMADSGHVLVWSHQIYHLICDISASLIVIEFKSLLPSAVIHVSNQLFAMFLARSLQGQIFEQRARWM